MKYIFPLAALAAAVSAASVSANDNPLEEVIVISSRVEMPLREVGTSVSVISAEDIEIRGFTTVYDALRSQPGVSVSNSGGLGSTTAVRIRGEDGFRTRAYIDGVDVTDTSGTQFGPRFEHMLTSGVSRVEILRGPQGLMYGADAGGVVNISTDALREGFEGIVSAEAGRYGTDQVSGLFSGGNGQLDGSLVVSRLSTEGFNSLASDTSGEDDGYENVTLHGRGGWTVNDMLRLEAVARKVRGEGKYDRCYSYPDGYLNDCVSNYDQRIWRLGAELDLGRFYSELSYSHSESERDFFAKGALSYGAVGELKRISYLGKFEIDDAADLVFGADLEDASLGEGESLRERDQKGYYLEYQDNHLDNLFLTAGVRYDDNDDFGDHTTYRVSAAYVVPLSAGELKFKTAYGTGFRAPSLYEIGYNAGPNAKLPASTTVLQPEESEGVDLGVAWASNSGVYVEFNLFDQQITDVIEFDLADYSGYLQYEGESESRGVELAFELPLGESVSLLGNYTYNDTETPDGQQRARRPEHLANLEAQWRLLNDRLHFGVAVRGAAEITGNNGEPLEDYTVVDINVDYAVTPKLGLYARVNNVLDEDYEEVRGYYTAGAAAYAGLRYTF